MFAKAYSPEQLSHSELDSFLKQGWFRMGQAIFTTNFVHFKNEMYSTVWLRVLLDKLDEDRVQTQLIKRTQIFTTRIGPAILTEEKEELYAKYKSYRSFQSSDSFRSLLFDSSNTHSIYHTYEVTVHDADKLIAIGFFDLGETSAAGIASVFDPSYKKYSLGKFLIYQKMQYCKNLKLRYFYPGYFVPGYASFDYKLTIGRTALQFLRLRSNQWIFIEDFSIADIHYQLMNEKLTQAQQLLARAGYDSIILKYEFFDANLIPDLRNTALFDFPVFLHCSTDGDMNPVLVFDPRDEKYHLLKCLPFWKPNDSNPDSSFYSEYFLKVVQEIHETTQAEEIVQLILGFDQATDTFKSFNETSSKH